MVAIPSVFSVSDQGPGSSAGGTPSGGKPSGEPPRSGLGAAYVLVASVGLGFAIGYAVDRRYDTFPAWTLGLCGLFTIAGLYQVVKDVLK